MSSVGISLGSETCVLAVAHAPGKQQVVADDMGERSTPFYVSYSAEEVLVGAAARNAVVRKPRNTASAILALASARNTDTVRPYKPTCAVEDVEVEGGDEAATQPEGAGVVLPTIADCGTGDEEEPQDTSREPQDLLLEYFSRMKTLIANASGNAAVGSLVVAVPRGTDTGIVLDSLRRSGVVAGTTTVRVVFDDACIAALSVPSTCVPLAGPSGSPTSGSPTSASPPPLGVDVAAGVVADITPEDQPDSEATAPTNDATVVIDWGANALRVSLIDRIGSSFRGAFFAESIGRVGGKQLDAAMAKAIADGFQRKTRADPREEPRSMRKLGLAIEKAKITLGVSNNASIELEAFCNGVDLQEAVSRMKLNLAFDSLGSDAVLDDLLKRCLASAKESSPVRRVVLSGGTCRVPRALEMLRRAIEKHCGKSVTVVDGHTTDEAAALGACVAAQSLPAQTSSWVDGEREVATLPADLVYQTPEGTAATLIPAGAPLPTQRSLKLAATPAGVALALGQRQSEADKQTVAWLGVAELPEGTLVVDVVVEEDGAVAVAAGKKRGRGDRHMSEVLRISSPPSA